MKLWIFNIITIAFFMLISRLITQLLPFEFPSSIIGLVLLFLALNSKILNIEYAEKACLLLNKYIGVLFVPAGVALIGYVDLVTENWFALITTALLSTIAVFYTVGHIYCFLNKGNK